MISVVLSDDPKSQGILVDVSGHASHLDDEPPELRALVCAALSHQTYSLKLFVQGWWPEAKAPDAPLEPWPEDQSGLLAVRVPPKHFAVLRFALHSYLLAQATYPRHVTVRQETTRLPA
jgi:hypothetical protein